SIRTCAPMRIPSDYRPAPTPGLALRRGGAGRYTGRIVHDPTRGNSAMLQPGEDFSGYLIRRRLGVGGMGMVFLARHPRLPRLVALKLLNPDLYSDREIRLRFERESELAGRLEHPNIVTVYDRGAEGKQ